MTFYFNLSLEATVQFMFSNIRSTGFSSGTVPDANLSPLYPAEVSHSFKANGNEKSNISCTI